MKLFRKYAEFIGYTVYHGERFNEWRCPNKRCGMGVSGEYICCPYCSQKIKFQKADSRIKKSGIVKGGKKEIGGKHMRVYISGPITGTPDFMERFAAAEEKLKKDGYEVFNPVKLNAIMPPGATRGDYMKLNLAMLSLCDTIYMLSGWAESRRALKEYHMAVAADMIVLHQYKYEGGEDAKEKQTGESARV